MTKEEQGELLDLARIVQGKVFQKQFTEPLEKYKQKQRQNFFSDSLKDSWRKGGRVEGINMFFTRLKSVQEEYEKMIRTQEEAK